MSEVTEVMRFREEYAFLSNMYEAPLTWDKRRYRNSEAAFQSAKSLDPWERAKFSVMAGVTAKRAGKKLLLRMDWNNVRLEIMEDILRAKFTQNPELREKLLATGDLELQEGNTWHDTFWGVNVKTGKGENHMGRLLMQLRQEFREEDAAALLPPEERQRREAEEKEALKAEIRKIRAELHPLFPWPDLTGQEIRTWDYGTATIVGQQYGDLNVRLCNGAYKTFQLPGCVVQGKLIPADREFVKKCIRIQALRYRLRKLEDRLGYSLAEPPAGLSI